MSQAVPENAAAQVAFQADIDSAPPGSLRRLTSKESAGPLLLKSAIELDGNNATIWALEGPVVQVCSPGVRLKNLRIEVTGNLDELGYPSSCALEVHQGADVHLEDVEVRGTIIGVAGEEGEWGYPCSLNLGWIEAQKDINFIIRIAVPCTCKLISEISGLDVKPHVLSEGINTVELGLEGLARDTLLTGTLVLQTPKFKRLIVVTGHACPTDGVTRKVAVDGELVWSCPIPEAAIPSPMPPPPSFPMEPASVPINSPTVADASVPTTDVKQPSAASLPPEPTSASIPGHVSLPVEAQATQAPAPAPAPAPEPKLDGTAIEPPPSQDPGGADPALTNADPAQGVPSPLPAVPPVHGAPPTFSLPTTGRTPKFKRPTTDFALESPFSTSTPISAPVDPTPTPSKPAGTKLSPLFTGSQPIDHGVDSSIQSTSVPATDPEQEIELPAIPEQKAKKPIAKLSSVFLPKNDDS